ncbi:MULTISPECIES: hypothetical protein [unclassified Leeuwenhoekiella]|uniref:hypothetical protein n=1 Tax=unclassified Leeuwenhoekiella TaxID=2615029 RepID=UPI0025B8E6C5|nr:MULTISPECIES: hypothetical protein [unclassified Leeuwenhoekiella]
MLYEGELYCNTVSSLIKNESETWGDKFEGITSLQNISDKKISFYNKELQEYVELEGINKALHFKRFREISNNILCLYTIDKENTKKGSLIISDRMKDFGNYALLITDPAKFYRKIMEACQEINLPFFTSKVHYYKLSEDQSSLTLFHKMEKYSCENEFRFIFLTDGIDIVKIKIGSMVDYAKIIPTKNLINKLNPPKISKI